MNKHFRACQTNGVHFVPLVVETLGGWDSDAVHHLQAIAKQTSSRSSLGASSVISHFFQRLSVLLQRANAGLIAARAPAPLLNRDSISDRAIFLLLFCLASTVYHF